MNYAEQIYKFRKEEGISQEALAVAIGTTRQQISRWECGCSIPSMKYITLMVEYFHTDIHTFMGTDMGEESKEAIDYDGKQSDSFTKMMGILSILVSCLYFIFGTLFEISGRIMFAMSRAGATIEDGQYSLFETE